MGRNEVDRFWSKVQIGASNKCWPWTGARFAKGYGSFDIKGKSVIAHRQAWQLEHEQPIPADMMICHHCDNPPCCNPRHLYLGTRATNMRDMWRRKRRVGKRPMCHPDRPHKCLGMCNACYIRQRRATRPKRVRMRDSVGRFYFVVTV